MPEKEAINFLKDALIDMAQNAEDIDTPRYYFFMLAISVHPFGALYSLTITINGTSASHFSKAP